MRSMFPMGVILFVRFKALQQAASCLEPIFSAASAQLVIGDMCVFELHEEPASRGLCQTQLPPSGALFQLWAVGRRIPP